MQNQSRQFIFNSPIRTSEIEHSISCDRFRKWGFIVPLNSIVFDWFQSLNVRLNTLGHTSEWSEFKLCSGEMRNNYVI